MKHIKWIIVLALLFVSVGGSLLAQSGTYFVSGSSRVNVRACAQLDCRIVTVLDPGSQVTVVDSVVGNAVGGNTTWFEVEIAGETAYVHSSLLSATAPESAQSDDTAADDSAAEPNTLPPGTLPGCDLRAWVINYQDQIVLFDELTAAFNEFDASFSESTRVTDLNLLRNRMINLRERLLALPFPECIAGSRQAYLDLMGGFIALGDAVLANNEQQANAALIQVENAANRLDTELANARNLFLQQGIDLD